MEKWFGRTYSSVGDTNKDFLIKTRGQIKVQYGKKFIDILKDGKLNIDNISILKRVGSVSEINGNGIYYCEDDDSIYIQIGDVLVKISDGTDSTYVSYINKQNISSGQRQLAQNNIGLVFNTLSDAQGVIVDGFVYIIDEQSFYTVSGGVFTKLKFEIPNPYPKQFVIKREDNASGGALKLEGDGKQNGITISKSTSIYEQGGNTFIENPFGSVIISAYNRYTLIIDNNKVTSLVDIITKGDFIGEDIHSENFVEGETGYRLYYNPSTGKSILEVDQIIERDAENLNKNIRTYSDGSIIAHAEVEEVVTSTGDTEYIYLFTINPYLELEVRDLVEIQPYCLIRTKAKEEYTQKIPILFYIEEIVDSTNIKAKLYPDDSIIEYREDIIIDFDGNQYQDNYILYHSNELGDLEIILGEDQDEFSDILYNSVIYRVAKEGDPNDPSTWLKTICTDYLNNSISLQHNYTYIQGGNIIASININTILGNIENYIETSEPHTISDQGIFTNQLISNGGVFREPLNSTAADLEVINFPRYSHTLNDILCDKHEEVADGNEFENVMPTIRWIKNQASKLNTPLKEINDANLGDPPLPELDDDGNEIPVAIVHDSNGWQYAKVVSYEYFKKCCEDMKNLLQNATQTFTVSWYTEAGTLYTTTTVPTGTTASSPSTDPSKKHWKFSGWDYDNSPITADTDIYAKWEYVPPKVYISVNPAYIDSKGGNATVSYYVEWDGDIITTGITVEGTYQNIDYQEDGNAYISGNKVNRDLIIEESTYSSLGKIHFEASFMGEIGTEPGMGEVTGEAVLQQLPANALSLTDFDLMKFSAEWTNITTDDMSSDPDWSTSDGGVTYKYKDGGDLDVYTYTCNTNIPITTTKTLDKYGVGYAGNKSFSQVTANSRLTMIVRKEETQIFDDLGNEITKTTIEDYNINNTNAAGVPLDPDYGKDVYDLYQYLVWSGDNITSGVEYTVLNFRKIIDETIRDGQKAIFIYIKTIWALTFNGTGDFNLAYDLYKITDKTKGLISEKNKYDFIEQDTSVQKIEGSKLTNLHQNMRGPGESFQSLTYYKDPAATLYYDLATKEITFIQGYYTEEDIYGKGTSGGSFTWN